MNGDGKSLAKTLAPPILMLIFGVVFLGWSYTYEAIEQQFPVIVGWALLVLGSLDIIACSGTKTGRVVAAFFTGQIVGEAARTDDGKSLAVVLTAMAWPVGFVAVVWIFGFILVIPVYVFAFVVVQGKKPVRMGIYAAMVSTGFAFIVFEVLLSYEVYNGLVFGG